MPASAVEIQRRLGHEPSVTEARWSVHDALLFAVAVGADLERDRRFLLEEHGPALLPTFASVASGSWLSALSRDRYDGLPMVVGGFEYLVHVPLPVEGRATTTASLVGIEVKRSVTVLWHETRTVDETGEVLISGRHPLLLRATDGFESAGVHGYLESPPAGQVTAERVEHLDVDRRAIAQYRPMLPLVAGQPGPDRLHTHPEVAAAAGLRDPILHSMAVVGHVGLAASRGDEALDAGTVAAFGGQFRNPLRPGDHLVVGMHAATDGWALDVRNGAGDVVLGDAWIRAR